MSTTFGVIIPTKENEDPIEVCHRHGIGNYKVAFDWINPLAELLPDNTPVIPLDNSAQGIYTIGDIKNAINQNK